jgi:hypothetical protein
VNSGLPEQFQRAAPGLAGSLRLRRKSVVFSRLLPPAAGQNLSGPVALTLASKHRQDVDKKQTKDDGKKLQAEAGILCPGGQNRPRAAAGEGRLRAGCFSEARTTSEEWWI